MRQEQEHRVQPRVRLLHDVRWTQHQVLLRHGSMQRCIATSDLNSPARRRCLCRRCRRPADTLEDYKQCKLLIRDAQGQSEKSLRF